MFKIEDVTTWYQSYRLEHLETVGIHLALWAWRLHLGHLLHVQVWMTFIFYVTLHFSLSDWRSYVNLYRENKKTRSLICVFFNNWLMCGLCEWGVYVIICLPLTCLFALCYVLCGVHAYTILFAWKWHVCFPACCCCCCRISSLTMLVWAGIIKFDSGLSLWSLERSITVRDSFFFLEMQMASEVLD